MGRAGSSAFGRAAYLAYNRGKEVVEINVKEAAGRTKLLELASTADVFVHNSRPGRAERLGFGFDDVARAAPGAVYCYASGWDASTVAPAEIAGDYLVQAHAGCGEGLRPPDAGPSPSPLTLVDVTGGLLAREGTWWALPARIDPLRLPRRHVVVRRGVAAAAARARRARNGSRDRATERTAAVGPARPAARDGGRIPRRRGRGSSLAPSGRARVRARAGSRGEPDRRASPAPRRNSVGAGAARRRSRGGRCPRRPPCAARRRDRWPTPGAARGQRGRRPHPGASRAEPQTARAGGNVPWFEVEDVARVPDVLQRRQPRERCRWIRLPHARAALVTKFVDVHAAARRRDGSPQASTHSTCPAESSVSVRAFSHSVLYAACRWLNAVSCSPTRATARRAPRPSRSTA